MSGQEMRKEFEKLYWLEYGEKRELPYDLMFKRVQVNNQYSEDDVDEAWYWFSRSREVMRPIKLPDATFETPSGDNAFREDAVIDAIQQAGYEVEE